MSKLVTYGPPHDYRHRCPGCAQEHRCDLLIGPPNSYAYSHFIRCPVNVKRYLVATTELINGVVTLSEVKQDA